MIITATMTASHVSTLSTAIIEHAKGTTKLSRIMREICTPPADLTTQEQLSEFREELACILTSARAQAATLKEAHIKYLNSRDAQSIGTFNKSFVNSWTYATKVASEAAGCKFTYKQHEGAFYVEEAKAAKEPTAAPANGREKGVNTDVHAANQAAGETHKAIDLPELPAENDKSKAAKQARAARIQAAHKAVRGLIQHGFTAAELADAFQAVMESAALKGAELDNELATQLAAAH